MRSRFSSCLALNLLIFLVPGCVYRQPYSLPSPRLGATYDAPQSLISGESSAWNFLWFKPIGNAADAQALKDAEQKQNVNADAIAQAQIEKTVYCFPLCSWPVVEYTQTKFRGALMANSLIKPYRPIPKVKNPKRLRPGELPSASVLEKSLESLFHQNPHEAFNFYSNLDMDTRGKIKDLIMIQDGSRDENRDFFLIPADATPKRKEFLHWFISRFTPYIPENLSRE